MFMVGHLPLFAWYLHNGGVTTSKEDRWLLRVQRIAARSLET